MNKTVTILGATGSVGLQAIDVARSRGYGVDTLTANRDAAAMESLCRELKPRTVAMADPAAARELFTRISDTGIKVYSGQEGIVAAINETTADTVVNSILGGAGLIPSLAVIDAGKRLALANKESLVIAGDIVMSRARERGVEIIPVDSEHSAIFQSLKAGHHGEIKSIILTASGGPFFGYTRDMLTGVTLADTLAHPTWKMGKKITVDSATLMNKGFELIEAVHLFSVAPERVRVVVHRESILHSAVEYIDNSVIGEFSVPDMRMCVQYAVDYPERQESASQPLDLVKLGALTFHAPDTDAFPFLDLARRAISMGGAMPAVMNAADEVAVEGFLNEQIGFTDIYTAVTNTFERLCAHKSTTDLDGILAADREARVVANEEISKLGGV